MEPFLKRFDVFTKIIQKNIFKFYLNIYNLVDDLFAILKLFICIHCCHTTYTFSC